MQSEGELTVEQIQQRAAELQAAQQQQQQVQQQQLPGKETFWQVRRASGSTSCC